MTPSFCSARTRSIAEAKSTYAEGTIASLMPGLRVIQVCLQRGHISGMFPILSGGTVVLALHYGFRHSKQTPLMSSIPTMILRSVVMCGFSPARIGPAPSDS